MLVTVPLPVTRDQQLVHREVVAYLLQLMQVKYVDVQVDLPTGMPIEDNRNRISKRVVDEGWDFWLSIDADNPPLGNCLAYCFLDKDIVGFPTPVFRWRRKSDYGEPPIHFNCYNYFQDRDGYREDPRRAGLYEVDAVGSGVVLIARRVLEHPQMRRCPWNRKYDNDGFVNRGSDLAFCERAKSAGFKVWAAADTPADHIKGCSLREMWDGFEGAYNRRFEQLQAEKKEAAVISSPEEL